MAKSSAAKPKVEPSKWARQPARSLDTGIEKRRQLWDALHEFIKRHGGWIVSPPDTATVRIEVPERSELPAKLTELGYRVLNMGTGTRLAPGATTETIKRPGRPEICVRQPGWVVIDVISITLPG